MASDRDIKTQDTASQDNVSQLDEVSNQVGEIKLLELQVRRLEQMVKGLKNVVTDVIGTAIPDQDVRQKLINAVNEVYDRYDKKVELYLQKQKEAAACQREQHGDSD